jgi:Superinfection immunity protein
MLERATMLTSTLLFPFFHFPGFFLVVSLLLYFLPAFLARDKHNFTAIFVLNLLAGWTFIGWIIALVWALSSDAQRQPAPPFQQPMASVPQQTMPRAPQPAASATFFCSSCGKRCTTGERFCSACGAAIPATQR